MSQLEGGKPPFAITSATQGASPHSTTFWALKVDISNIFRHGGADSMSEMLHPALDPPVLLSQYGNIQAVVQNTYAQII